MADAHPNEKLGTQGGIDKVGVQSIQVPYWARTIEEAATVAQSRMVNGLPESSRTWQANEAGFYDVTVTYEGKNEDGANPQEQVQYALKASFKEEPIEAHPKLAEIKKKYGGYEQGGRVVFPPFLPASATAKSQGSRAKKGDSDQVKNPFFGVEKYMVPEVTWTVTYAARSIPADILKSIGKLIPNPPGNPPTIEGRTKWLVMAPSATQRGNVVQITQEYQLISELYPDELYDIGSVSSTTGDNGFAQESGNQDAWSFNTGVSRIPAIKRTL